MSIPKEPRQLMINLMYIVLTALLALNVSAEVMNAFFDLNKSLKKSISLTQKDSSETWKSIQKSLESKSELKAPISKAVEEVNISVDKMVQEIQQLQEELIDLSGNQNGIQDEGDFLNEKPIGFKNKDISTRLLVNEGRADEIKENILSLRDSLIQIYSETLSDKNIKESRSLNEGKISTLIANLTNSLPLYIESEEEIKLKSKDGKSMSWAAYKFNQMPLVAVLPILSKLQNDAEMSRAILMSKFAEMTGGLNLKLNNFFPVIIPEKSYVIEGEPFKAKVGIGAYSNELGKSSSVYVNGVKVNIGTDGWGDYVNTINTSGPQKLKMKANVYNPHTKKYYEGDEEFTYEVGKRSASISPTKMNLFYIGVDNPLNISVAGAPSASVRVDCKGCNIAKDGNHYIATAMKPGIAKVSVSAKDFPKTSFDFRVKRIPDPLPKLGDGLSKYGGMIGNAEFRLYKRLDAHLKDFEFDATCNVVGFELSREPKNDDVVTLKNNGANYNEKILRMTSRAKPGDNYYFDKIKAKCPGDQRPRKLPSLMFRIK